MFVIVKGKVDRFHGDLFQFVDAKGKLTGANAMVFREVERAFARYYPDRRDASLTILSGCPNRDGASSYWIHRLTSSQGVKPLFRRAAVVSVRTTTSGGTLGGHSWPKRSVCPHLASNPERARPFFPGVPMGLQPRHRRRQGRSAQSSGPVGGVHVMTRS